MMGLHLTFGTYGFWLPNDPRGSGSKVVKAQHLYDAGGPATTVDCQHSVAGKAHDRSLRLRTKAALKYPAVKLTGLQARTAAIGMGEIAARIGLRVNAFAMMPDHVHCVVGVHRLNGEELIECLKRAGTRAMNAVGLHPLKDSPRPNGKLRSPWGEKGWVDFLDTVEEVRRLIHYVEDNPLRAGLKPQNWPFVIKFEG
jgi:REP element-mobilizing transposase RayT